MIRTTSILCAAFAVFVLTVCGERVSDGRIKLAYVTNGIDPFWTIAAAGVRAGAKEFDVAVQGLGADALSAD